jgi:hypothetical protein
MLFIAYTENTATYSHRMELMILSPLATCCPITGPSPHMRQLLDCGTWHQQQLKQLAAFLTPHTQWFISHGFFYPYKSVLHYKLLRRR